MRAVGFRLFTILLATASMAAAQAAPEQTAADPSRPVQTLSRRTPEWLSVGAAYRFRTESRAGDGFRAGTSDSYGLSRLLVDLGVQPRSWLRFQLQGQDARAPGRQNAAPVFRDPFDVRQAWVRLGNPKRHWVHATVGRQELNYGAQRLVGPLDWTNTARQFDAAKLTIGRDGLSVDLFAASVVPIDDESWNRRRDGANLHGLHARLGRWVKSGVLEAYTFWKTDPRSTAELGGVSDTDLFTNGFRMALPLPRGFDFETEIATQFGDRAGDDITAWGGYWILGCPTGDGAWKPRLSVEYQYGSGDSDPRDGRVGTFDQLFPTGHLYQGVADQVGWRNIQDVRTGLQVEPRKDVSLTLDYFAFWLASRQDHLYGVDGRIAVFAPTGGAEHSYVGSEIDSVASWKLRSHLTAGGGLGVFLPGSFLRESTPGRRHVFGYLFVNYVL
jgi:hypothetical protein